MCKSKGGKTMVDSNAIRKAHPDIATGNLDLALDNSVDLSEKEFISLVFKGKVIAILSVIDWESDTEEVNHAPLLNGVSVFISHTVGATIVSTEDDYTKELLIP